MTIIYTIPKEAKSRNLNKKNYIVLYAKFNGDSDNKTDLQW